MAISCRALVMQGTVFLVLNNFEKISDKHIRNLFICAGFEPTLTPLEHINYRLRQVSDIWLIFQFPSKGKLKIFIQILNNLLP